MQQGYQCPNCEKQLVFLPQYQYWHCQGCGGYFVFQQTPAAYQSPPEGKSKIWIWITVIIAVLVIIPIVLMTTVFSGDEDSGDENGTTETTPLGVLDFTESFTPGLYTGSFVSLSKAVDISDTAVTITDDSLGQSASQDPLDPETTLQISGGLNFTYYDYNENSKIDGGDTIRIHDAESGDIIKFVYRPTGGVIAQYTFI